MDGNTVASIISGVVILSGGAFTLSIRHLFKSVSKVEESQEKTEERLQKTREGYVSSISCKEDRELFTKNLDKLETGINKRLDKHGESMEKVHEVMSLVLTEVRNGNGNGKH